MDLSTGDDQDRVVGGRADWRFLLPTGPRERTLIIDHQAAGSESGNRCGASSEPDSLDAQWRWLVDDGWTDDVSLLCPLASETPGDLGADQRADVVLVRSTDLAGWALAAAEPTATIVVEMGRLKRPAWRLRTQLAAAGFIEQRLYLATPDLARPKRLTPLGSANGLRWLLAVLGGAPRSRVVDRLGLAGRLAGPLARVLRTSVGSAIGHRLIVATRRQPSGVAGDMLAANDRPGLDRLLPPGCDDAVLMTSGHDAGSRAILLPVGKGASTPNCVIKVSVRPGFNRNVDDEVAVIKSMREAVGPAGGNLAGGDMTGQDLADLFPEVESLFDHGLLRGSKERYAGRLTAADICYASPDRRSEVLQRVLRAMTDLNLAVGLGSNAEPWSASRFEHLVEGPFRRYTELVETKPELELLLNDLVERSVELSGRPLLDTQRHYDLGPWNVVFDVEDRLTIVDWERAGNRSLSSTGPAGADQLYFGKYWLHIALSTASIDDEVRAFEFRFEDGRHRSRGEQFDARSDVTDVVSAELHRLGIDRGFVPLLAVHVWLEKALYTITRRGEPGDAEHYLQALARHRRSLLDHWPVG